MTLAEWSSEEQRSSLVVANDDVDACERVEYVADHNVARYGCKLTRREPPERFELVGRRERFGRRRLRARLPKGGERFEGIGQHAP